MPRRSFHDAITVNDFYRFTDEDLEPDDDEFDDPDDITDDDIVDADDDEGDIPAPVGA